SIGGLIPVDENSSVPLESVAALWPLKVGKRIAYAVKDKSAAWDVELLVLRRESVTVKAGSFDSYVVQQHEKRRGPNPNESIRTYWYAPGLGGLVKFDIANLAGTTGLTPWEAVGIAGPAAAGPGAAPS